MIHERQTIVTKCLSSLALILFVGCASHTALQSDYAGYSEVYGDANNQQMLLNLAREEHEEPIYFIQLASISSQYQFMLGGGVSSSVTKNYPSEYLSSQSTTTGATPPTGGDTSSSGFTAFMKYMFGISGSANTSFTQTPIFQFIPLTGTNLSGAVLNPISDKVFYTFYDQDWPADWVARIMVDSVAHENIRSVTTTNLGIWMQSANILTNYVPIVITNKANQVSPYLEEEYTAVIATNFVPSPVPIITQHLETNYEYWVNDPNSSSYPHFLEYCKTLRFLQRYNILGIDRGSGSNIVDIARDPSKVKLADIVSAIGSGLSVNYIPASNLLVVSKQNQDFKFHKNQIPTPGFSTNPGYFDKMNRQYSLQQLATNEDYQAARDWVLYPKAQLLADRIVADHIKLKMRTFEAALFSAANEQREFEYYETHTPPYANLSFQANQYGPVATLILGDGVPYNVRPILTLHYRAMERAQLTKVAQIGHDGETYTIGDLEGRYARHDPLIGDRFNVYQNRMVFSLVNYLFLQTAINSQNLPVQQLIQVQ